MLAIQRAANESKASIEKALQGTDMVFVTVSNSSAPPNMCVEEGHCNHGDQSMSLIDMMQHAAISVPNKQAFQACCGLLNVTSPSAAHFWPQISAHLCKVGPAIVSSSHTTFCTAMQNGTFTMAQEECHAYVKDCIWSRCRQAWVVGRAVELPL